MENDKKKLFILTSWFVVCVVENYYNDLRVEITTNVISLMKMIKINGSNLFLFHQRCMYELIKWFNAAELNE